MDDSLALPTQPTTLTKLRDENADLRAQLRVLEARNETLQMQLNGYRMGNNQLRSQLKRALDKEG